MKAKATWMAALLCPAMALGAVTQAHAYELGPADRLRITVSEWPASGGDIRLVLDGQYAIDMAGNLSLPYVGDVAARARSTSDLAAQISQAFQAKLGSVKLPTSSVEIVEYRPFYVVGAVDKPGSFPFRPGMRAIHALSIAGGVYRRQSTDIGRLQRDMVSASGEASLQVASRSALLVRQARLEAELAGEDAFTLSPSLGLPADDPVVARAHADETKVLRERQVSLRAAVAAQENLRRLAQKQSAALADQEAAQNQQLAIARKELADYTDLLAKGLTRRPLIFPIEMRIAEAESKKRQLHSDLLKNQQDIARATQAIADLSFERRKENLDALKETRDTIERTRQRFETASRLSDHSEGEIARRNGEGTLLYTILRQAKDGSFQETAASEGTPIVPGDVLRVTVPMRDTQGGVMAGGARGGAPPAARTTSGTQLSRSGS